MDQPFRASGVSIQPLAMLTELNLPTRDETPRAKADRILRIVRCLQQQIECLNRECEHDRSEVLKHHVATPMKQVLVTLGGICNSLALKAGEMPSSGEMESWITQCQSLSTKMSQVIQSLLERMARKDEGQVQESEGEASTLETADALLQQIKDKSPLIESQLRALCNQVEHISFRSETHEMTHYLMRSLNGLFAQTFITELFSEDSGPRFQELKMLQTSVGLAYSMLWAHRKIYELINPLADRIALNSRRVLSCQKNLESVSKIIDACLSRIFPYEVKYKSAGDQNAIIEAAAEHLLRFPQEVGIKVDGVELQQDSIEPSDESHAFTLPVLKAEQQQQEREVLDLKKPVKQTLQTLASIIEALERYSLDESSPAVGKHPDLLAERDALVALMRGIVDQLNDSWNQISLYTCFEKARLEMYECFASLAHGLQSLQIEIAPVHQHLRATRLAHKSREYHQTQFDTKSAGCLELFRRIESFILCYKKGVDDIQEKIDKFKGLASEVLSYTSRRNKDNFLVQLGVVFPEREEETRLIKPFDDLCVNFVFEMEAMRDKLAVRYIKFDELKGALQRDFSRIRSTLARWPKESLKDPSDDFSVYYRSEKVHQLSACFQSVVGTVASTWSTFVGSPSSLALARGQGLGMATVGSSEFELLDDVDENAS